jgi:LysM repeat protein
MSILLGLMMAFHPVTVKSGDSLWSLFGLNWQRVAQYNQLKDPNLIYPGEKLLLPDSISNYESTMEMEPNPVVSISASEPQQQSAPIQIVSQPQPAPIQSSGGWTGPWACIAQHESGGNPATNTGNGYYGGLQFSLSTWLANGGTGNPADASIAQQEAIANRVLASSGWGAWPNTSVMCGL